MPVASSAAPRGNPPIRWLTLNEGMHTLHLVYFFFFCCYTRLCVSTLTSFRYDVAKGINFSAGACDYALVRTRAQTLVVRQNDSISQRRRRWKQACKVALLISEALIGEAHTCSRHMHGPMVVVVG